VITPERFPGGVWFCDFEFHPVGCEEGNLPYPVCMAAREFFSGRTILVWGHELTALKEPPFSTDGSALMVAYNVSAEVGCFLELGWPLPVNTLDLFVVFRNHTNGRHLEAGAGLLGALAYFGLPAMTVAEKDANRDLVLRGGPWSQSERQEILDYCLSDVVALGHLLPALLPYIDWPRAPLYGRYGIAVAKMQNAGVPVDMGALNALREGWHDIQGQFIQEVGAQYGVFDNSSFRRDRFAHYLREEGIPWPLLPSGELDLRDETFKTMSEVYPQIGPLRELRKTLSKLQAFSLPVGSDARNRCSLKPFGTITGRNTPSPSEFVFGLPKWLRGLIKPAKGFGIALLDYSQQEFGIAAALSGDERMKAAYATGDVYLAFAKQSGAVPLDATADSHPQEREQFKQCVLAVQYGMGPESLALRIKQPIARARELLALHRSTYSTFWRWSDRVEFQAAFGRRLWTTLGWQLHTDGLLKPRTNRNFPMQANGAEMLRLACIRLTEDGIRVCAPVHDALLIEAPIGVLDATVAHTQSVLRQAGADILGGFELRSDIKIIRYPDRYMDKKGRAMWNTVMRLLGLHDRVVPDP
jgi:DNA polymerase I